MCVDQFAPGIKTDDAAIVTWPGRLAFQVFKALYADTLLFRYY
jgi:hypothetical protein